MPKPPPAKKKRIRNPVETRAKLLQATVELVSEKGAAALSMKEAALRANVSRGVAYLHFEDRDQLLQAAKNWVSEGLQDGITRFNNGGSLHDRTFHNTKLVLKHPEATRQMLSAAMSGVDLNREHPLYRLVLSLLKKLRASGKVRPDVDLEILTYIMFGSIASTLMLGAQRKGENIDGLADRFADEWNRILQDGLFISAPSITVGKRVARKKRTKTAVKS